VRRKPIHKISKQLVEPARRDEIAELAEAVADEHCPSDRVDPLAIARAKGVTHSFGAYGDAFDGMLELHAGRWHIYGNRDRVGGPDTPRARFTVAHELGHYFLDEHRNAMIAGRVAAHRSQCEYESPNLAEQEADHFGANLLMPLARFGKQTKRAPRGLAGVLSLAEWFGASLTATAIRCAECDLWPCLVVKWSWRGYAWKRLSSSTFEARFACTVESADKLTEGSPTWKALGRHEPPGTGYFEAGTTASAWFPRVGQGTERDILFIEQAIPLGRFGVLTLLRPEAGQYGK
jgi:uncharacterized protein DUF955